MNRTSLPSTPLRRLARGAAGLSLAAGLLAPTAAFAAAIGVTDDGTNIIVDTHAGLVYSVKKASGDVTSIKWNGTELNDSAKASHISSGIGAATTWATSPSGATVVITETTSTLTHYIVSRNADPTMYMATYISAEPSVGELRWITRLKGTILTGVPAQSNINGNTGAIESSDVFGYANGQSTSKYYGNQMAKDLSIRGVTGSGVGVFMAYGNRESSSGGPFFRDIQNQSGTDSEVYNYMNSGHNQTEAFRTGVLHGPYALIFTNGSTPSVPDMSWMSSLGLTGWVSSRGTVIGNGLAGRDTAYTYIVGFANSTAQYWVTAAASNGSFGSYGMKPGTYTMTVYKSELAVYTESVTVSAGGTTTLNTRTITGDPSATSTIWRIGNWDGEPKEFLNGNNISQMHPSDVRNADWGPKTFAVGSAASGFPAIQFRGNNSPTTITFSLTSAQAAAAHVLKIGITSAYIGGRPSVVINGHALTNPAASTQPDSRSVTIGTYRGNNKTYSWTVPAGDFVTGTNTMTISPISGSSDSGAWLSANFAYDCVELAN